MVATGELATIDALEMSCLTNKSREVVERGEKFRKERQEEADERFAKQQENTDNQNDNEETTNEN